MNVYAFGLLVSVLAYLLVGNYAGRPHLMKSTFRFPIHWR